MQALQPARVIVAANRGPFTRHDGHWRRGDGGLVSALRHLADLTPALWISVQNEPASALDPPLPALGRFPIGMRGIATDPAAYGAYYDRIANHLLWFVQHQLPDAPAFGDGWGWDWAQYCRINQQFAEEIARQADGRPALVMVHDYHLYLVPWFLKRLAPQVTVEHFTHIPWPPADAWRVVPDALVRRILTGMLASDIVGFNAERYVSHFLDTCRRYRQPLGNCRVTHYPVSVDLPFLRHIAASPEVLGQAGDLPAGDGPLIVQIGRTDPSKNLLCGLRALERVAAQHPTCRYLGLFPPSRQSHPVYQKHLEDIRQMADLLAARFGERIRVVFENRFHLGLCAMQHYDVLLVNSLADGMNLVAKEGPAVNQRDGVLILSPETGAFEQLGHASLRVDPCDPEATADLILAALELPATVRHRMLVTQRLQLEQNTVHHWLGRQLADLGEVQARRLMRAG